MVLGSSPVAVKSKIFSTPKHSTYNDTDVNSSFDIPILNESPECRNKPSKESLPFPVSATCESEEQDLTTKLKTFKVRNINSIIIAYIDTNSIRNKVDLLAEGVRGSIDILMVSETRSQFIIKSQFIIGGFATLDQTNKGEGIVVYIIEDILLSCSKRLIFMTKLNA